MSIIEAVRAYIATCPLIPELDAINVEYQGADVGSYSIDPVPADPVVKTYLNGSSLRRFTFVFSSREFYGRDVLSNLENSLFYERFSDWLDEQNRAKNFPALEANLQPVSIRAINVGYAFATDLDAAQYQIQCQLEYLKK